MFYDMNQAVNACVDDPSMVFNVIKCGYFEVIEELIRKNKIDVNICDTNGNDVVTRLLKAKQYDLVLQLMKKRKWDVNHKNNDGNTFGHILALDNSIATLSIFSQLTKNKNYLPNIKNNNGETVLDKAINNNYLCTAFKILEDKRFNNIDISSFRKLCQACLKNVYYGKYAKLNNLEVIVGSLEKKDLRPSMEKLMVRINERFDDIKNELMSNCCSLLDEIIDISLIEATV